MGAAFLTAGISLYSFGTHHSNSSASAPTPKREDLSPKSASTAPVTLKTATSLSTFPVNDQSFLENLNIPYGFAIDPIHNRLIWTSSSNETFMWANLNGSEITSVESNFEEPYHIQIETSFGYDLFFLDNGALKQITVDTQLGSSSEKTLLDVDQNNVHGLGFDDVWNTLYIGDQFGRPNYAISLALDNKNIEAVPITPLNTTQP